MGVTLDPRAVRRALELRAADDRERAEFLRAAFGGSAPRRSGRGRSVRPLREIEFDLARKVARDRGAGPADDRFVDSVMAQLAIARRRPVTSGATRHRRASSSRSARRRGSRRCSSGTRAGPDAGGDDDPGDLVALSRRRRGPHREARS